MKTALSIALTCLLSVPLFCAITMVAIENYSLFQGYRPWPEPASFWDRANDLTCSLLFTLTSPVARPAVFATFLPLPAIATIQGRRRTRHAILLLLLILAMISASFPGRISDEIYLCSFLLVPFALRDTLVLFGARSTENTLLRACLLTIVLTFLTATIALGFGVLPC